MYFMSTTCGRPQRGEGESSSFGRRWEGGKKFRFSCGCHKWMTPICKVGHSLFQCCQVKLAHQESELVIQLKKIPLGVEEMAIIRDRAEKLRDGKLKSRGEALLPITLASFIFDSLCLPGKMSNQKRALFKLPKEMVDCMMSNHNRALFKLSNRNGHLYDVQSE